MAFVWFLAIRHLRHRTTQSLTAILGVAMGIMVLTTSLSLTNGFVEGLMSSTIKAVPHVNLQTLEPGAPPPAANPEIEASAPVMITKTLVVRRGSAGRSARTNFGTIIGLGKNGENIYPDLHLKPFKPGTIVLGGDLARWLGVFVGDKVFLVTASQNRIQLEVVGMFSTGNYLLDSGYAFVDIADVDTITQDSEVVSGYQLHLYHPQKAPQIAKALASRYYLTSSWQDSNRVLIQQMALQKKVIGVVVFLIVCVAALGMANVLVLTVIEKTSDIALLRVLGAEAKQVAGVFMLEGLVLGSAGVVLGNALGFGLSSYFKAHPISIPGDMYFLNQLPVVMRSDDFIWASAMSLLVVLLASSLPLIRVLRIKPGAILR